MVARTKPRQHFYAFFDSSALNFGFRYHWLSQFSHSGFILRLKHLIRFKKQVLVVLPLIALTIAVLTQFGKPHSNPRTNLGSLQKQDYLSKPSIAHHSSPDSTAGRINGIIEQDNIRLRKASTFQGPVVDYHKTALFEWRCGDSKHQKHGGIHQCSYSRRETPALLWSFPGCGNTWVRKLLEEASGIGTGSVYEDNSLKDVLRGEGTCSEANICIKAHPTTHPFDLVTNHIAAARGEPPVRSFQRFRNSAIKSSVDPFNVWQSFGRRCRSEHHGQSGMNFSRAIVIDRHPLDAAFSELQRRMGMRSHAGTQESHTYRLPSDFEKRASPRVWTKLCEEFLNLGFDYVLAWESYVRFRQRFGSESMLIINYEDLRDEEKQKAVLLQILCFLRIPLVAETVDSVFARAKNAAIYRQSSNLEKEGADKSSDLSVAHILQSKYNGKPLVDWMMAILSPVSSIRDIHPIVGVHWPSDTTLPKYSSKPMYMLPTAMRRSMKLWEKTSRFLERQAQRDLFSPEENSFSDINRVVLSPDEELLPPSSESMLECVQNAWSIQKEGRVIVIFAGDTKPENIERKSSNFVRVVNTLIWDNRNGVDGVLIATPEWMLHSMLKSHGISSCLMDADVQNIGQENDSPRALRSSELYVIEFLLRAGLKVVHSNLEAVWTGNPVAMVAKLHQTESGSMGIVASGPFEMSEGRNYDRRVSKIGMGLISFLPEKEVIRFVRRARGVEMDANGAKDDERYRSLSALGLRRDEKNGNGSLVISYRSSGLKRLRIVGMPESLYDRDCSNTGEKSIVMHCYTKARKDEDSNMFQKRMEKHGLWAVKKDWYLGLDSSDKMGRAWLNELSS